MVWWLVAFGLLFPACSGKKNRDRGENERSSASSSVVLEAEPNSANEPIFILFDWSAPCRVPVTEHRTKKNKQVQMSYELVLSFEGKALKLRFENPRILDMEGMGRGGAAKQALEAGPARQMMQATMPPLRISVHGEALEVVGDLSREWLDAVEGAGFPVSDDARTVTEAASIRAMVEAQHLMTWVYWVEFWTQNALPAGEPYLLEAEIGEPWRLQFVGMVRGSPELALVQATASDDDLMVKDWMGSDIPPPLNNHEILEARVKLDEQILAAIEPHTGRPHRVRRTVDTQHNGTVQTETYDWTFDWKRADGCGRK